MDRAPINSYPDEVARKWKEERDRYRDALESMSFWTCTACEENMAIRDKALAHNSDDYKAHHCKHGTRGIYCFDFHPRHEREKCDAARDAAFKTQQDNQPKGKP